MRVSLASLGCKNVEGVCPGLVVEMRVSLASLGKNVEGVAPGLVVVMRVGLGAWLGNNVGKVNRCHHAWI